MTTQYIVLRPNEDGSPIVLIGDINEFLSNPIDHGVSSFLKVWPKEPNPQYWSYGSALLLKVEIVVPKEVVTAYKL